MANDTTFVLAFEPVREPRHKRNLAYPLIDVITLAVYGTLCGKRSFTEMEYFLKLREGQLTEVFGLANGVPSHDVFSRVFRLIDPDEFMECFVDWLREAYLLVTGKHLALDGKAMRAAAEKSGGGITPYVISAYLCDVGITVAQIEIGEKKNEISELPRLIMMLDLEGCDVTIDAIGCQVEIMDLIKARGGDFCLQVKANQPTAMEGVAEYFDDIDKKEETGRPHADVDTYEVSEKGHGRVETRSYTVSTCEGDARDMLPDSWVHAVCVGRCAHVCTRAGKTTTETHYYVLSRQVSARELARLSRSHWQIENCLHWVLDVIFGEDTLTNREDASISNLSALRKVAFNMTKMLPEAEGLTGHNREDLFTIRPDLAARLFYEIIPSEALKGKGSRDDR